MVPSSFDWVKALSQCTLAEAFERLLQDVKVDVEGRNALLPERSFKFAVMAPAHNIFRVALVTTDLVGAPQKRIVRFYLESDAIEVKDEKDDLIFRATLTLNDEGQCRFRVNDQELDSWHVRKRALEDLFFRNERLSY
jgi:hypothetical protein